MITHPTGDAIESRWPCNNLLWRPHRNEDMEIHDHGSLGADDLAAAFGAADDGKPSRGRFRHAHRHTHRLGSLRGTHSHGHVHHKPQRRAQQHPHEHTHGYAVATDIARAVDIADTVSRLWREPRRADADTVRYLRSLDTLRAEHAASRTHHQSAD